MSNNIIPCKSILSIEDNKKIEKMIDFNLNIDDAISDIAKKFKIQITSDTDVVKAYERDYSNIPGNANSVCHPKNEKECAIMLNYCHQSKIPITIAAGRTNLNGSATPIGGMVMAMNKMTTPKPKINMQLQTMTTPVGIYLEDMRNAVLNQSQKKLYFPVDPTSRNDAMIGGTVSCNASGFMPGPQGAIRHWVNSLDFLTPNGFKISCKRGQYISKDGFFIISCKNKTIKWSLPTYPRPNIKNASGPYSDESGKIDLVDLLIGSEGIFGVITKVNFKLKKRPNDFLNLFFTLPSEKQAVRFHHYMEKALHNDLSQLSAMEYFGYNCQNYMKHKTKFFQSSKQVGIYLQIPIYEKNMENIAENWLHILMKSKCGINENEIYLLNNSTDWQTFFEARHSIPENALKKTHQLDTWSILTDTIVPSENFAKLLNETHLILKKSKIEYLLFGHLGDCHLHFHFIPTKEQQSLALKIYGKIIKICSKLGGVYSAEHGTGKRKRNDFKECYGKDAVNQILQSKASLDPNFLLNKGNVIIS